MKTADESARSLHAKPMARRGWLAAAVTLVGAGVAWQVAPALARSKQVLLPLDDGGGTASTTAEVAVLAGGCFWGVQGVFQRVHGVNSAVSGYAGGQLATARYEQVGSGTTGHAEAVEVRFDRRQISFGQLLQIHFSVVHDPTQLDRQGPDVGPQYRSTVFAQSAEQARIARAYIAQLDQAQAFSRRIATTVELGKPFFPAEAFHQDYLTLRPNHPYIAIHDLPKIRSLQRVFPARYRAMPVLVGPGPSSTRARQMTGT